MKKIMFNDFKCLVNTQDTYLNGAIAIQLYEEGTGEPVAHATINVMQGLIKQDEVVIKDYSENEGMLEALVKAGVVSEPLRFIPISGFVNAPVCKLI